MLASNSVVFKVQLGAYKNVNNVNFDERLNNWGDIQQEPLDGGLTRVLLGDFNTKTQADAARDKALEFGRSRSLCSSLQRRIENPDEPGCKKLTVSVVKHKSGSAIRYCAPFFISGILINPFLSAS